MVIVVCEARESRQAAVVSLPLAFFLFPLLFPSADLVVQLGLPVDLVRRLPVEQANGGGSQKNGPASTMTSAAALAKANNRRGHRSLPGPLPLFTFTFELPPSLWADVLARPPLPPFITRQETAALHWHELRQCFLVQVDRYV